MFTKVTMHRKRNQLVIFLPVIALLLLVVIPFLGGKETITHAAGGFSFTAAGDYGQTTNTTATLTHIGNAGASFNLGLGDYNYDPNVSADAWSSYAKSHLPANFPFEIVAGDHDKSQLSTLATDLPNRISGMTGTYASNYSFDYPTSGPLARFIMISPGLSGNYNAGGTDYNWVLQQIDGARAAHIHWIIVGMAKGCVFINSISNKSGCSSPDLFNLLISKKVDLILQAHVHNYEASKQLATNGTTCKTIPSTTYNAACVVNSAASVTKGVGTIIANIGTGGKSLVSLTTTDPKTGYFRTWSGSNVHPTYGFAKFSISATSLREQFVHVSGSFSDSFSISG